VPSLLYAVVLLSVCQTVSLFSHYNNYLYIAFMT